MSSNFSAIATRFSSFISISHLWISTPPGVRSPFLIRLWTPVPIPRSLSLEILTNPRSTSTPFRGWLGPARQRLSGEESIPKPISWRVAASPCLSRGQGARHPKPSACQPEPHAQTGGGQIPRERASAWSPPLEDALPSICCAQSSP